MVRVGANDIGGDHSGQLGLAVGIDIGGAQPAVLADGQCSASRGLRQPNGACWNRPSDRPPRQEPRVIVNENVNERMAKADRRRSSGIEPDDWPEAERSVHVEISAGNRGSLRKQRRSIQLWRNGPVVLQPSHREMAKGSSMDGTLHETTSKWAAATHHRLEPSPHRYASDSPPDNAAIALH